MNKQTKVSATTVDALMGSSWSDATVMQERGKINTIKPCLVAKSVSPCSAM